MKHKILDTNILILNTGMKKIITLLLVVTSTLSFAQQDPQFSQYQFNQMVINPAYAGSRDAISALVDLRSQWAGSGAPRTQAFSLHSPLKKKRIGLGLSGYADQIGPKNTVGVYGSFAYILPVSNKLKLSFGLRGGFVSYKFDWAKLTYENPTEQQAVNSLQNQHTKFDLDAGLYLKSNSFYCGLSVTHLNSAKIYNEQLSNSVAGGSSINFKYTMRPHLFFIISKGFAAGENLVINPTIMIKSSEGIASTDLNINFLIKKRVWLGTFLRSGGTMGFLAQFYATDKLRIGYAFDRSFSKIQNQLGSGHEIMIGFDFSTFKATMLSPRYL